MALTKRRVFCASPRLLLTSPRSEWLRCCDTVSMGLHICSCFLPSSLYRLYNLTSSLFASPLSSCSLLVVLSTSAVSSHSLALIFYLRFSTVVVFIPCLSHLSPHCISSRTCPCFRFRVPLNVIVVIFLVNIGNFHRDWLFLGCAVLCAVAAAGHRSLTNELAAEAFAIQQTLAKQKRPATVVPTDTAVSLAAEEEH